MAQLKLSYLYFMSNGPEKVQVNEMFTLCIYKVQPSVDHLHSVQLALCADILNSYDFYTNLLQMYIIFLTKYDNIIKNSCFMWFCS